jgi:uncharacterized membrane protein
MTEAEYLDRLGRALRGRVGDVADILSEYEEHFARKRADGFGEEEIAAGLERPDVLAEQFALSERGGRRRINVLAAVCIPILSIVVLSCSLALFAWVAIMGAASLASLAVGASLLVGASPLGLIPPMPYSGGALLGLACLALASLAAIGMVYSFLFAVQLDRAYFRWAGNRIGPSTYPPLPIHPEIAPRRRRSMRDIALVSLAVFGVAFVVGFTTLAAEAGGLGFWHIWHWFA